MIKRFTLIELIVVLSVISLLMTMLVPALNKVRSETRRITCINNMRSVYIGFSSYAVENNNFLPESKAGRWQHEVCKQLDIGGDATDYPPYQWHFKPGTESITICPDVVPPSTGPKWKSGPGYSDDHWGSSYAMTVKYFDSGHYNLEPPTTTQYGGSSVTRLGEEPKRFNQVTDGSVILVEAPYIRFLWEAAVTTNGILPFELRESYYDSTHTYGIGWLHDEQSNFLIKDGHVITAELGTTADDDWRLE